MDCIQVLFNGLQTGFFVFLNQTVRVLDTILKIIKDNKKDESKWAGRWILNVGRKIRSRKRQSGLAFTYPRRNSILNKTADAHPHMYLSISEKNLGTDYCKSSCLSHEATSTSTAAPFFDSPRMLVCVCRLPSCFLLFHVHSPEITSWSFECLEQRIYMIYICMIQCICIWYGYDMPVII